jgi:glycosyltransferase involved in cell wall biosynthesis
LVDQLVVGWYGGVAVELMALAKPVIAHIDPADLDALPEAMRSELPVIDANAQTLTDVLHDLLTTRRHELPEIGRRSRSFAEKWHDPNVLAARTEAAYRDALRR